MVDENNLKLLLLLIKYADDDIWQEIYEKIFSTEEYEYRHSDNYLVKLLSRYLYNQKDHNEENIDFYDNYGEDFNLYDSEKINIFFSEVLKVAEPFKCFCIENKKEKANKFEQLIRTIIKTNKFIYWTFVIDECSNNYDLYSQLKENNNTNKYLELFYENITDTTYSKYSFRGNLLIEIDKYNMYLRKNDRKMLIKGKRQIPKDMEINKFIETYEALSSAIDKFNREYCPWCNPNEALEHTPRQRKCQACEEIADYLTSTKKIDNKKLNDTITGIRASELDKTVRERGKYLLNLQEKFKLLLRNEKNYYTHIQELIKTQYWLNN